MSWLFLKTNNSSLCAKTASNAAVMFVLDLKWRPYQEFSGKETNRKQSAKTSDSTLNLNPYCISVWNQIMNMQTETSHLRH